MLTPFDRPHYTYSVFLASDAAQIGSFDIQALGKSTATCTDLKLTVSRQLLYYLWEKHHVLRMHAPDARTSEHSGHDDEYRSQNRSQLSGTEVERKLRCALIDHALTRNAD